MRRACVAAFLAAAALGGCVVSDRAPTGTPTPAAEVRPPGNPENNAYFGDLHVHTKVSVDSFLRSNVLKPEDAYRFARGEAVAPDAVEPAYLRDKVALTLAEQGKPAPR